MVSDVMQGRKGRFRGAIHLASPITVVSDDFLFSEPFYLVVILFGSGF
jgi:hypothetical protein